MKNKPKLDVMVHLCNPSTWGGRGRQISEFKVTLVYSMSSRIARAFHRETWCQKNKNK